MKRSLELQVKICSLASESAIIRRLERKQLSAARYMKAAKSNRADDFYSAHFSLRSHRVLIVRRETRASLLAQAFIRGMPYTRVETPAKKDRYEDGAALGSALDRAADLVLKYTDLESGFEGRPKDVSIQDWSKKRKTRIVKLLHDWTEVVAAPVEAKS